MDNVVTVIKRNTAGEETWRYSGTVLQREPHSIQLEASFNRNDMQLEEITLKNGDRFVEWYYNNRWYNIFEIHDRDDDRLKAWYCNVGEPAEIGADIIAYNDLALDLLVYPDGRQTVLDEDEFEKLKLSPDMKSRARKALAELQELFTSGRDFRDGNRKEP